MKLNPKRHCRTRQTFNCDPSKWNHVDQRHGFSDTTPEQFSQVNSVFSCWWARQMVRKTTITLMILMPLFVHLGCGLQSSAIEPAADNVKSDKRGRRDPAELATQPSAFPASQPAGRPSPTRGWPNWLGPNYDGISHENDWSSDWPEAGLPIAWSRQDIGIGFSSV